MSTIYIKLDEAPEILQKRVNEIIERYSSSKLLSISRFISTPYKDKSITRIMYTSHFQIANYFLVAKYGVCSNPDFTDAEVQEDGMIVSEIIEFVKQSDWLQHGVQEALRDGKSEGILPLSDL